MCRSTIQTIEEVKRASQIKLISRDWSWCSSAPSFVVEHAFHLCVVGVLTLVHCSQANARATEHKAHVDGAAFKEADDDGNFPPDLFVKINNLKELAVKNAVEELGGS